MFLRTLAAVSMLLVLALAGLAQKGKDKPYTEWSKDECLKIVQRSAWSRTFTDISIATMTRPFNERDSDNPVAPEIIIRLSSSSKVQKAFYRMMQIDSKYDQMTTGQKEDFDRRNSKALSCDECKDYYIVTIQQPSDPQARENLIGARFLDVKFEELVKNLYLTNDKKQRRDLAKYVAPASKNGFITLYFPRLDDSGNPFLTPENKKLTLVSKLGNVNARVQHLIEETSTFDVSKMIVDGKVDF